MISAITRGVRAPKIPGPTRSRTWTPINQMLKVGIGLGIREVGIGGDMI